MKEDALIIQDQLQELRVGDIFCANYIGISGRIGSAICLVIDSNENLLIARSVTTQDEIKFIRNSGEAFSDSGEENFVVKSIKPLPSGIHSVIIGLDRRYRAGDDPKLTKSEIEALLFLDAHYADELGSA